MWWFRCSIGEYKKSANVTAQTNSAASRIVTLKAYENVKQKLKLPTTTTVSVPSFTCASIFVRKSVLHALKTPATIKHKRLSTIAALSSFDATLIRLSTASCCTHNIKGKTVLYYQERRINTIGGCFKRCRVYCLLIRCVVWRGIVDGTLDDEFVHIILAQGNVFRQKCIKNRIHCLAKNGWNLTRNRETET